jgi:hypothetical protein
MGEGLDDLFQDSDDPFDDAPTLREMLVGAPRPAKDYVLCPFTWLARVRPLVRSADQLLVLLVLYRRCLVQRSKTVDLPNGELTELGIGRKTKYRTLRFLEEAGAVTVDERQNGRSLRVTLHWFP